MHEVLVVGDLGNSSLRLGQFLPGAGESVSGSMRRPQRTFRTSLDQLEYSAIDSWLDETLDSGGQIAWRLGSVNRPALKAFVGWIEGRHERLHVATYQDFALPLSVRYPERVGVDRIAAAFAVNALRPRHHAAIIIDAGTAITVDCVTANGQFIGGAIAPGIQLGLDVLTRRTDLLPHTSIRSTPPLIGTDTSEAIRAGIYWLTALGIKGYVDQLISEFAGPCSLYATGGSLPLLLPNLQGNVQHLPDLVLSGLAMVDL